MTTKENRDHALMEELGATEDDMNEALSPAIEQVRLMAEDKGRDPEEFFLSLDTELFAALAIGYLDARRRLHRRQVAAHGRPQHRAHPGARRTPGLIPLATALGRRTR